MCQAPRAGVSWSVSIGAVATTAAAFLSLRSARRHPQQQRRPLATAMPPAVLLPRRVSKIMEVCQKRRRARAKASASSAANRSRCGGTNGAALSTRRAPLLFSTPHPPPPSQPMPRIGQRLSPATAPSPHWHKLRHSRCLCGSLLSRRGRPLPCLLLLHPLRTIPRAPALLLPPAQPLAAHPRLHRHLLRRCQLLPLLLQRRRCILLSSQRPLRHRHSPPPLPHRWQRRFALAAAAERRQGRIVFLPRPPALRRCSLRRAPPRWGPSHRCRPRRWLSVGAPRPLEGAPAALCL